MNDGEKILFKTRSFDRIYKELAELEAKNKSRCMIVCLEDRYIRGNILGLYSDIEEDYILNEREDDSLYE